MRRATKFKVEGLKALDQALGEMKQSTAKNVLRKAGREALGVFDDAWRKNAPVQVDGPERTKPHMKETGGAGTNTKSMTRRGSLVEVAAGPGKNPPAVWAEFGTRHQAPRPFVRPAWEETKHQVLENVKTSLEAEIEATAQRAARAAKKAGG